jgi:hypothetical protein
MVTDHITLSDQAALHKRRHRQSGIAHRLHIIHRTIHRPSFDRDLRHLTANRALNGFALALIIVAFFLLITALWSVMIGGHQFDATWYWQK